MKDNGKTPLVLGHRGFRARYPENTLLAFREAMSAGADGVECDVQKTADGQYVVIHDHTTDRITGFRGDVARMSFEQLRELDFGSGESIPLLDDFLALLPGDVYLDVELKEETLTPEDCQKIANILVARRNRTHLMISSFNPALLVHFKKTGFTVGYLVGDDALANGWKGFARTLMGLKPQYLNLPVQMFDRLGSKKALSLLRLFRFCGFSLLFWTVNTPAEAALIWKFACIVVTDDVEALLKERHSRQ